MYIPVFLLFIETTITLTESYQLNPHDLRVINNCACTDLEFVWESQNARLASETLAILVHFLCLEYVLLIPKTERGKPCQPNRNQNLNRIVSPADIPPNWN